MEYFITLMTMIIEFMKRPIVLWEYETSLWGIFLFVMLAGFVFSFIGGLFSD